MAVNESALDKWTIAHAATGLCAAKLGMPLRQYLALAVAYELLEHSIESPRGSVFLGTKRPETRINVLTDLLAGVVGYRLGL